MKGSYVALAMAMLAVLSACSDGGAPSVPSVPSPSPSPTSSVAGDIAIRSITPAPGAALEVKTCRSASAAGNSLICTENLQMTFDISSNRDIPNAVLTAVFSDGTRQCGIAYSPETAVAAGARVSLRPATVFLSREADDFTTIVQPCALPITTTRMVVQLWQRDRPATPLLTREFAATYTFAAP